ncbi:site-specific tyrosine recombinase/integron integrase [Pectinatus brassicae]|uniref:Site-specific recombinase XerD n=1 Tax=Pectinatus brassicae TaxID=862415 RepID=A0A840UG76_9FIRM|nr:site-specific tyrosine recombinase/integron integrase [Pectinatus brassicae]MBB5336116.1 site-specific recombinase XerD [Pectinatus brassicae]
MNQEIINSVMYQMNRFLDNQQLMELKRVLENVINKEEISEDDSFELLKRFISTKKLEGRSDKTLKYYKSTVEKMLLVVDKNVKAITTDDLREYLTDYQSRSTVSKQSVDNVRRNLSSFFTWLEDENYILKSPVRRIHKIKTTSPVKETYTDDEMERLRDSCKEIRDLAMIDLLSSTGMRVGELVLLNRDDIDFNERECIVLGKGDKERRVYFDARTKLHLQEYLKSRSDTNPALFVGLRAPNERLEIGGVEVRIRKLGRDIGIKKCHPHKFRRTMATVAIDKGMPIEQVQKLLGHEKIDTTLHYAMVKQSNVKNAHRKYIG